ncbi:MAG: sulfoxide reductase heme-binding subunit YedZ [Oceanospirillales bacterium]|nr:sulfoxide reductase heme-binding subunit YedZ [Oceanospirillales bacterium]
MVLSIADIHRSSTGRRVFWWLMFLLPLMPLAWIVFKTLEQDLGADPAQTIVTFLGLWTLRFLLITLAVTPVRRVFGWLWAQRYRRMYGLYTLFYACLHLLAFATFILGWRPDLIARELSERPYIIVGFIAWLGLVALGMTSTRGWVRRLGRRWQQLHYLVYPIAVLAMVHFAWLIRAGFGQVLFYALLLALLLGYRVKSLVKRRAGIVHPS